MANFKGDSSVKTWLFAIAQNIASDQLRSLKRLAWGDGKGLRTYTLKNNRDGTITFTLHEHIGGLMFPMYAKYIPGFDENFNAFAADLKKEVVLIQIKAN